jgi:hypothetical protein
MYNKHFLMREQCWDLEQLRSEMMIESMMMRCGHCPEGVIEITLNPKALQQWVLSLRIAA